MQASEQALSVKDASVSAIQAALMQRSWSDQGVLIHYTDPFLIRASGLKGLAQWREPRILVCGDLHHGPTPIKTLEEYLSVEFHDSLLLAFNPSLIGEVCSRVSVPVHCCPPGFFRYPRRIRSLSPKPQLVHVGSLGPHHPRRRALVKALIGRGKIPFQHLTTDTPDQAADVYAENALVLNIPLNNDLNHRFFEVMAAGAPQLVFAQRGLLGPLDQLLDRPDLIWVDQLEELERMALRCLDDRISLPQQVEPPPQWPIADLLRLCLGSVPRHTIAPVLL